MQIRSTIHLNVRNRNRKQRNFLLSDLVNTIISMKLYETTLKKCPFNEEIIRTGTELN